MRNWRCWLSTAAPSRSASCVVSLALCERHRVAHLDNLVIILDAWGSVPDDEPVRERRKPKVRCPVCPKRCPDRKTMVSHVRRTHHVSIEDIEREARTEDAAAYYHCKYCDEPPFSSTHKLGAHVRNRHPQETAKRPRSRRRTRS